MRYINLTNLIKLMKIRRQRKMAESENKKYEYEYYGIWSSTSNSWVFGIMHPLKN